MRILENTAREWSELYQEMINSNDYSIEIKLDVAAKDMLNLKYFLPLADRLNKAGIPQITLIIIPDTVTEAQVEAYIKRLSRFFSEWKKVPYIRIQIGNRELPSIAWTVSRIFPICHVVRAEDKKQDEKRYLCYKDLKECYYDSASRTNVPKDNGNYLIRYCNQLLDWLMDENNFTGTIESRLSKKDKLELKTSMEDFVCRHLAHMNILAQIIWLYILRDLLETKQLYVLPDTDQKGDSRAASPLINFKILTKSRMDAITYAEGLYQVIENACFYSEDQQGWFGFRMHRAGKKLH